MIIKNKSRVAILLASYNGEHYIQQQIDSILNQTYGDWVLYIRDDGSTDDTVNICKEYAKLDGRIFLLPDKEAHIGSARSFMKLLSIVDSDLYMFCDQDDVWLKDKIKLSVDLYDKYYTNHNKPVVIHTDVAVVDQFLNTITPSYWKSAHLDPDKYKSYNYLAICCYTQGNTMLFNKRSKEVSFPMPSYANAHDWWVSTRTIKNNGCIISLKTPTLLYRQHRNNVYGFRTGVNAKLLARIKNIRGVYDENIRIYRRLNRDNYGSFFKFLYYKTKLLLGMHLK